MLTDCYWSRDQNKELFLCELHHESRSQGKPDWLTRHGWIAVNGKHEGIECDDCKEEEGVEDKGLDAHIALVRRYDAWVVVDESVRWYDKMEVLTLAEAARYLRGAWVGWMAPTQELAEARMQELISVGDGTRRYSVRKAIDVLLEDIECELIAMLREARVC